MSKETALVPSTEEFNIYQVMAKKASESQFFGKIGGEAGLLSIMLYARELGLPPLQCIFGGMSNIQGKIELSPRLMNTMIRKAGHRLEIIEATDQACKIKGIRHDTKEEYVASFTIDDARRAGLVRGGGGWEKYASDMLFARCISRLARRLFADVISTAYVEGEIGEEAHDYKAQEKIQEATVIQEAKAPEQLEPITKEEAQDIEKSFTEDDMEYRQRLLASCSKEYGIAMIDFTSLPKKALEPLWNAILRRKAKKEKEMEAAQLEAQGEKE
jgi:hypothetical protein